MQRYTALKARQRAEREQHPESLALRVHRALSWLNRAEQCEDDDGRFIFLWISFNAAYSNELGDLKISEGKMFNEFLTRLVQLDAHKNLAGLIWQQYTGAIRALLDNHYIYQPYWNHLNQQDGYSDWQDSFNHAKQSAHKALANNDTGKVLTVVFNRLYTLRNQLVHGGATWNSRINRDQLRDANRIMGTLVPLVIEIMMDNAKEHWGEACYPAIKV